MATGFWGRSKRERQAEQDAQDASLARRAGQALVQADEKVRLTSDELNFAFAELGDAATRDLRTALESVKHHLGEAFQLHQLNVDEIPDTAEELRTRNARIVQLCDWALDVIDERTAALEGAISKARRAPEVLAGVLVDAEKLRLRLDGARDSLGRLSLRYSDAALQQVSRNVDEAEQLISFATHSADISTRRREAGQREQAQLALEAATESTRRAATLLDAIENYEIEALRAESTLAAVVEDSRGDLIRARTAPRSNDVSTAMDLLERRLGELPAAGTRSDPFASLSTLRQANTGLDEAIARAVERAARPVPSLAQVATARDDADRQLAVARDVIAGHRGWIGADARTRLAEAERLRQELDSRGTSEDDREQSLPLARRVSQLAGEALQLAQRDIDQSRPRNDDDWGWGGDQRGRRGNDMGDAFGGILGGLVIGGILGDIFD